MLAAICDDEAVFRKDLHEFLLEYRKSRRLQLDIVEFSDGEALLNSKENFDIVLLDYEMPQLNGMETARRLRAKKSLSCIIFLTSYPEHVFEAFEVNTYRYLTKPLDKQQLSDALDTFIGEKKMMAPIVVNVNGEQLTIQSEDVIYLEAEGKFCNIRTNDKFVRSSKTLARVHELLPQHCFYRTHKSYAVNFYCVVTVKDNTVLLTNNEKVLISRKKIAAFKKAYKEFIKHFIVRM